MKLPLLQPLLLSLLVCASAGCGGAPAASPGGAPVAADKTHAKAAEAKDVKKPGEAAVGDATTCPISKEAFTVTASSPKVDYKGKTYYFCCGGCDAKFKENPEKYLEPASSPGT